jgi:hypothetical protein
MVAAAACGTTVPHASKRLSQGGQQVVAGGSGNNQGAATDANGNPIPGGSSVNGGGGGGGAGGSSTGGRAGSVSAAGSTTGGGSSSSSSSGGGSAPPGVTATTINLGLLYSVNGGAANAAVGAGGISQGDEKANDQILIDDINAHGGVLGRKLVPVYHAIDATSADTIDSQLQAACDDLTQDHKVFAVFTGGTESFKQCLQSRGVAALEDDLTGSDTATFQRYPYYLEIGSMNLDRIAAAEVPALQAQGYFAPWDSVNGTTAATGKAKTGIVTYDSPSFAHAVDKVLVPALANLGYAPDQADIVRVQELHRESDAGAISAQVSSAVLKLHSDGVEHVFVFEANGLLTLFFMSAAESQHYFPRYGSNTQNGNQALLDAGDVQKQQLVGSMGIGWLPSLDITPSENTDDGPYSNDARRRCLALMKAHGQTYSDTNAEAVALGTCNQFSFFHDAVTAGGPTISRDTLIAGAYKLGSSWQHNVVFATFFGPGHHDGVAAFRYWAFQDQCGCMRYTTGNIHAD